MTMHSLVVRPDHPDCPTPTYKVHTTCCPHDTVEEVSAADDREARVQAAQQARSDPHHGGVGDAA